MSSRSRLSDTQVQEILVAYQRGDHPEGIAARYGISPSYPGVLAKKHGVRRAGQGTRRRSELPTRRLADTLTDDIAEPLIAKPKTASVADIRRLHGMGRGRTEIAALLRCKYSEIEAALAA